LELKLPNLEITRHKNKTNKTKQTESAIANANLSALDK